MNNSTANGIGQARNKNKLANDAAVLERNRKGTGRRDNNSRSGSSSLTSRNSGINSSVNSSKTSLNSKKNNQEAKNRFQRNFDRKVKLAEKIPIPELQKAAKIAKVASAISSSKPSRGGILKNFVGGLTGFGNSFSKKDQNEETETDAMGEDYEPDQAFGNVSVKLDKKTTLLLIGILAGAMGAALFIGVIVMSAMTDSAGEAYLASKQNPTEAELAEAYAAQDSSGNSSGITSGSGTLSFSESYTDGTATSEFTIFSSEPDPAIAVNYWDKDGQIKASNFIYPKDKQTGKSLGAWPKNYKDYPTQLSNYKIYQGNFIWPVTPTKEKYSHVYEHAGIDIMADFGAPIYSPVDGTLVYSTWGHTVNKGSDETAYSVTIIPSKTVTYNSTEIGEIFLTHMSGIVYRCEQGECNRTVKKGELLGFIGNAAGDSGTPGWASHLHMTYYPRGNYGGAVYTSSMESLYGISSGDVRKAGQ